MNLNLQRRELIQGLRGIAIILVVAHHAISNFNTVDMLNKLAKFFDMFHVNIFFFMAGYLFMKNRNKYEQNGFKNFLQKKIKTIFAPYYLSSVLFALCIKTGFTIPAIGTILMQKSYNEKTLLEIILDPFWFHNPYFSSLWFIYVLFGYFIVAWLRSRGQLAVRNLIMAFAVSMLVNAFFYSHYPDIIYKLIRYYPYFLLGMVIYQQKGQNVYLHMQTIIFAGIGMALIAVRVYTIDISFLPRYIRAVYMQFEWLICALCAIVVTAAIVQRLLSHGKGRRLVSIGNKSYSIYLLHNPWVIVPAAILSSAFIENAIINVAVNFLLGLTVPIVFMEICKKFLARRGEKASG